MPASLLTLTSVVLAVGLLGTAILRPASPRTTARLLFAALIAALVPLPALADAGGVNTVVDLSAIANSAIAALAAVALWVGRAVTSALVGYLAQKTKLELDDHTRAYLDRILERGIQYAEANAHRRIAPAVSAINVRSFVAADAVNYVMDRAPDALAHFGITPKALTDMVQARMQAGLPWLVGTVGTIGDRSDPAMVQDGPAPLPTGAPTGG